MSGPGSDDPREKTPVDGDRSSGSNAEPGDGATTEGSEETPRGERSADDADRTSDSGSTPDEAHSTPAPEAGSGASEDEALEPGEAPFRWFLGTDNGTVVAIRDVLSSVAIVAVIGLVLFGVSGIWPPMVAVESGSMEPNMERGDLVFIADEERFVGDGSTGDTGVVTADNGVENGHETFGQAGDVIVFRPEGSEFRTPVIHRAHFWVEAGENWVEERADPDDLNGATTCEQVMACPANHDGFVTKGDANSGYDQANAGARTDVVRPDWIEGKGMFRVPWLGHVRLVFDDLLATGPTGIESATPGGATGTGEPSLSTPPSPPSPSPGSAAIGVATAVGATTVVRRRARK